MRPPSRATRLGWACGASLAEMVISLTLMGLVMIPVVLVSSAWFSEQLLKTREGVSVHHHVSQWLNRLVFELSQTTVLMPNSNERQVEFAYFDATRQLTRKRRYRLLAYVPQPSSGLQGAETAEPSETEEEGKKRYYLEELDFNERTHQWDATSPYGIGQASAILMDERARFYFCTETQCGVPPTRATLVKLMGWTFQKQNNPESARLNLPDVRLYLADSGMDLAQVATQSFQRFHFQLPILSKQAYPLVLSPQANFSVLTPAGYLMGFTPSGVSRYQYQPIALEEGLDQNAYEAGYQTEKQLFLDRRDARQIELFRWMPQLARFQRVRSLSYQTWLDEVADLAVDPSDNLLILLDEAGQQLLLMSQQSWHTPGLVPARISLPMAARPCAVAVNPRTGDILVLDSDRKDSGQLILFVMGRNGRMRKAIPIPISGFRPLPEDDRFRMAYEPLQNRLVLVGKTSGHGYGVMLSERL